MFETEQVVLIYIDATALEIVKVSTRAYKRD